MPRAVGWQCPSHVELALDLPQSGKESETLPSVYFNSLFTQTRLGWVIRKRDRADWPLCHFVPLSLPVPACSL